MHFVFIAVVMSKRSKLSFNSNYDNKKISVTET